MKATKQNAPRQTDYKFTGNSIGVHTRMPMVVRSVEFLDNRVHVCATIGDDENSTRRVEFDMTYTEAREVDVIERVEE